MKQHMLSVSSLATSDIEDILTKAREFELKEKEKEVSSSSCKDKIVGIMFLEPSTRTHKSFECAAYKLGAKVMHYNHADSSSVKGESFQDTVTTMAQYVDALVIRQPVCGGLKKIQCDVPMVNAGDGNGEHPTQALLDLYTIRKYFPIKKGLLHIAFVGDLKNGRTIHSTLQLLDAMYEGVFFHFVCEENLKLDEAYTRRLHNRYYFEQRLSTIIDMMDVVYMTRMQKERFAQDGVGDAPCQHVLTPDVMRHAKKGMIVMHPLPRNNELPTELDNNPHCKFVEQMKNGVYVRMAILERLLS